MLDVDRNGNVYITWLEYGDTLAIHWLKLTSSGSMTTTMRISEEVDGSEMVWYPDIAVSDDGTSHVVWMHGTSDGNTIYFARISSSAALEVDPVEILQNRLISYLYPRVGIDSYGALHATVTMWDRFRDYQVGYARFDSEGVVDLEENLDDMLLGTHGFAA